MMKFFRKHKVLFTRIICAVLAAAMILPMVLSSVL